MTDFLKTLITAVCALFCTCGASCQVNAEQMLRVGQNALYFEDYMLSIQYFNQAIAAKPYLAQPWFFRSVAKLNLDDYLGSEADASAAIERNPFIADAYEVRGVARQNQGKLRDAVADYDAALALAPRSRGLMFNKALAQEELNDLDSATVTFNQLLESYPGFDNGYVGRARLYLHKGDTVAALADVDKALELNRNLANAYLLRADVTIKGYDMARANVAGADTLSANRWQRAEQDLSHAIRLLPREAGLYVNRAYLRYNLDDFFGAMADYDYAIQLDPLNTAAIYNRALLRMETADNDRAIQDFTRVLENDPTDYRSLYNRALLYAETRNYAKAIEDINEVMKGNPEMPEALYFRSDIYRRQGKMAQAEKDYNRALALSKNLKPKPMEGTAITPGSNSARDDADSGTGDAPMTSEEVAKRFTALRTVDREIDVDREYNNKDIRGRVQDNQQRIEIEPMFAVTYYIAPTDLRPSGYYMKEADDINQTRVLRMSLQVTNQPVTLTEEDDIQRHFKSIDYYTSYLSTHTPRAIDYFGRAIDFMMVRDYAAAIEDLNRAVALTPDFALAYFVRGVARAALFSAGRGDRENALINGRTVIADFDKALELSPRMPFALFNKGNMLAEMGDFTSALSAYSKAIELKPDFGEAYYNRGYAYFQLGNREKGAENLSKAGELGVIPSYNLLKRMK